MTIGDDNTRQLRVGILGVGGVAQAAHLPALTKARNIELLAACDTAQEVLELIAKRYSIPRAYTDASHLLADPDIEAVVIAVADQFHAPLSIAAMQAGKHVLVEKPLASTVPECEAMVAVAQQTDRQLQVGCMKRFDPALEAAQRFVREAPEVPILVSGWYCDSRYHSAYLRSLLLPFVTSAQQKRPREHYPDPLLGALLGHGVHALDLLRFFGGDIVAVTARGNTLHHDTTLLAILEYANGATGTFTLVTTVQMDWFEGLHVHGKNGSVIARIPFPFTRRPSNVQIFDARAGEYRTPTSPDADPYGGHKIILGKLYAQASEPSRCSHVGVSPK